MVASTGAPVIDVVNPLSPRDNSAATASIARYLASGERVGALMDLAWKACLALAALLVVTWALGVLPGAVKLF